MKNLKITVNGTAYDVQVEEVAAGARSCCCARSGCQACRTRRCACSGRCARPGCRSGTRRC